MAEPKKQFKRTQVIVEKKFQFRFARFVILFAAGTALFTSLTVFFTTFSLLGGKLADVYPQGRLVEIFQSVYVAFAVNLLVIAPVIFWISIRFSHHIIGPMPKIYEILRRVGQGDFSQQVVLRKKDELRELAAAVNQMIESLKEREKKKS